MGWFSAVFLVPLKLWLTQLAFKLQQKQHELEARELKRKQAEQLHSKR